MKWTKYHVELAVNHGANLMGINLRSLDLRGIRVGVEDLNPADLYGPDPENPGCSWVRINDIDSKRRLTLIER